MPSLFSLCLCVILLNGVACCTFPHQAFPRNEARVSCSSSQINGFNLTRMNIFDLESSVEFRKILQGDTGVIYTESCLLIKAVSQHSEKGSATGWSSWNNALRTTHQLLAGGFCITMTSHQSALSQVIGVCGTNNGTLWLKYPWP